MADVQPPVPPDLWASAVAPLASAAVGMAMRYAQRFRDRKPLDWRQVVVDAPMLLGAIIGGPALAEYMGWGPKTACGVTMAIGWGGMRAFDALWLWLQAKIPAAPNLDAAP